MIAVSFPCGPFVYPRHLQYSHAQISYHVFNALRENFEGVAFFPQNQGSFPLRGNDILVSNLSPHTEHWKRTILVEPDNFEEDKWMRACFSKYGMNHPTDEVLHYNKHYEGTLAILCMSNDVAIRKWNSDHPSVARKKAFLLQAAPSVTVMPHPIDKKFFGAPYRDDARFDRARMFIFGEGDRKNAKQLVAMLEKLGKKRGEDFEVTGWFNKSEQAVRTILDSCMFFGHTSISECFPYLANEFMCGGLMLFGHEEWWDGQGNELLTWTYDPARQEENEHKLETLFDPGYLGVLHDLRKSQRAAHVERTDNNWRCLTDVLVKEIKKNG